MKKIIVLISFVFMLTIGAVSAYYFYTKYKESQVKPQEQLQQKPMNEIESLLKSRETHSTSYRRKPNHFYSDG